MKKPGFLLAAAASLAAIGRIPVPSNSPAGSPPTGGRSASIQSPTQHSQPMRQQAPRAPLTMRMQAPYLSGGGLPYASGSGGCPPDVWGRSRACARMVRKNRLHRAGLSDAKI